MEKIVQVYLYDALNKVRTLGNEFIDRVIKQHEGEISRIYKKKESLYFWVEIKLKCC